MHKTCFAIACGFGMTALAFGARAQQPEAAPAEPAATPAPPPAVPGTEPGASGSVEPGSAQLGATTTMSVDGGGDTTPWIERYTPTGMFGEVGLFLGILFPSKNHNFHDEFGEYQELSSAAFDFGIRGAFLPFPYGGAELEGALMPTATEDDQGATVWAVRAHGLVQAPVSSITPFALLGGGRMGVLSDPLNDDADPLLYWGLGAKVGINDRVIARLDIRDNLTQKNGADEGALTHHPEILIGLSYRIPPLASEPPARQPTTDRDGDGVIDADDACPDVPGSSATGCPPPDADQDGFPDDVDECPETRGVAPHGCPPVDTDGDGFFDDSDACPEEAGIAPEGCPPADTDGDGINDPDDRCPQEPETVNGYEDEDGCPDELPQAVQEFTGAIQGIQFETGKATITEDSHETLDQAVAVLNEYPELRIEIAGHTDNTGGREENLELSEARAASVKTYLVEQGIDEARIETVGYGPDRPVVSNDSAEGRAKNRRIEFRLLP